MIELPAEEGGHVLRPHRMNRCPHEPIVHGSQVLLALEDDVGGVLDLHQAPVVAGGELDRHGTVLANLALEPVVQGLGPHPVGELLRAPEVVHVDEGVIEEPVADPSRSSRAPTQLWPLRQNCSRKGTQVGTRM